MQNFCLSEAIRERFESVEEELGYAERIVQLDCEEIDTWEFRDRERFELGDLDELALSIQHKGQCQPIIVVETSEIFRPKENNKAPFVVIAGYRRWMACKKHAMKVHAVIREFNFEQAIAALVSENEKENVSDWSRGLFYHSLLHKEKITQEQLSQRLNISPSILSQYLAFVQVPSQIWEAVGNLSRVSAKSAATVRAIANKGEMYIQALIAIADKIGKGYGDKRIRDEVNKYLTKKLNIKPPHKIKKHQFKYHGKTLLTMNKDKIKLNKDIVNHDHFKELLETLEKDIADFADHYLLKNNKPAL